METMTPTIKSWKEIVKNHDQFNRAMKNTNSIPYKRFALFYHWYYFPKHLAFAPSKFIGYEGTTAINYKGSGDGGVTVNALEKYFYMVDSNTRDFAKLKAKLDLFASQINRKINKKTYLGIGGIYLPKKEYLNQNRKKNSSLLSTVKRDLEAQKDEDTFPPTSEGAKKQKLVSYYERKLKLRVKAISIHGFICKVCGFDFNRNYGELGKHYIEVHHLKPISGFDNETLVDPKSEMTVLCSNCHRMIHRRKKKLLSIAQLKKIINKNDALFRSSMTIPKK